jgi:hypothetical protein
MCAEAALELDKPAPASLTSAVKIDSLLKMPSPSMLVIQERDSHKIVIGVPHHAPAGTVRLPCNRVSDENCGYLGHLLAEKLRCSSIIACNYTIDVNKSLQTDYSMQIARWKPTVLVEIHGHGGGKVGSNTIEISSGTSTDNKFSMALAEELTTIFSDIERLKNISVIGDFHRIYFKATESVTITNTKWTSYHVELPPCLRKPKRVTGVKPPRLGYMFCESLAEALHRLHKTGR